MKVLILDSIDFTILLSFYKKPSTSYHELMTQTLLKSTSSVKWRVDRLTTAGFLVAPPITGQHRSRSISKDGIDILKRERMIN